MQDFRHDIGLDPGSVGRSLYDRNVAGPSGALLVIAVRRGRKCRVSGGGGRGRAVVAVRRAAQRRRRRAGGRRPRLHFFHGRRREPRTSALSRFVYGVKYGGQRDRGKTTGCKKGAKETAAEPDVNIALRLVRSKPYQVTYRNRSFSKLILPWSRLKEVQ